MFFPMPKRSALFLAAAALAALSILLRPWRGARNSNTGPAPDFRLQDTGGRSVSLSEHKGQVVLLNFWATWCESCEVELPVLDRVYKRHRGPGFDLLAVSVDENGKKAVVPFLAKHPLPFPVLYTDPQTSQAYHVFGLPSNFLIDAQGRIARVYSGPVDEKTLENDILELQAAAQKKI